LENIMIFTDIPQRIFSRHRAAHSPSAHLRFPRQRGATLVEMMMVVAIVGTSLALAIPLYKSASINGQSSQMREACDSQMQALAQAEEGYLVRNRVYASTLSALECASLRCPCATVNTSASDYTITLFTDSTGVPGFRVTCPIASAHQVGSKRQMTSDRNGIAFAYISN
jgi:prepilin-type N-terminal cleavage/methylation domain-containing protein